MGLVAWGLVGCPKGQPPAAPPGAGTVDARRDVVELHDQEVPPRQPDGVFFDMEPATPLPRVTASAIGVVRLVPPLSRPETLAVVRAYFRAFLGGDAAAFGPLLASGARKLDDAQPGADLRAALERRLRTVDYSHLQVETAAAYDEVRIVSYDAAPGDARARHEMREGDVLVEVPVRMQSIALVRVFGARLLFLLRHDRARDAWLIAGVGENDGPWP